MPTDGELVALCARLHPQLVGTLTICCGDRGVAEELAQEALIRLWDRWPSVARMDSPEGWTHHVAMNLARSWLRRRAAERRALRRLGPAPDADTGLDAGDVLALRRAVACLPPRQRAVIAWRFYAGLNVAQTADVLGCAPGTVKSLTSKATVALRKYAGFVVPDGEGGRP